ncbi:MAG: GNAT family N-acetyltransferase [Pseudomonadota bacterium]
MSFQFAKSEIEDRAASTRTDSPARSLSIVWDDGPAASAKAWGALYDKVPYAAYQQHYAYGEVIAGLGGGVHRAVVRRGDAPIALIQLQNRRFFGCATLATIMRGPVWVPEEIDDALKVDVYRLIKQTAPIKGLKALLLMPETAEATAEADAGLIRAVSAYHTVLVDLEREEDALRRAMDGKWRNRLRAAEKAALDIVKLGRKPADYSWLLQEEAEQQGRAGYHALPPAFTTLFQEAAGASTVFALEAKQGAERLGGVLFLRHGRGATYHIGWASETGKRLNVHNLLMWRAMLALKQKGVATLDLGGLDTNQRPGIARFKLGLGGRLFSQAGAFCLSPSRL